MKTPDDPSLSERRHPAADAQSGTRVALLACGERERGDDGAALTAVASLPAAIVEIVDVVRCGQLEVDDLLAIPEGQGCVIADAAVGVRPGEVVVASLDAIAARSARGSPRSSHTLPPDQAIALAGALRGAPPRGVFVGIGGVDFRLGAGLSPEVRAGLPGYVDALVAEIVRLAMEPEG